MPVQLGVHSLTVRLMRALSQECQYQLPIQNQIIDYEKIILIHLSLIVMYNAGVITNGSSKT